MRVRLTLAFTGVMALVLAGTGLFLYLRLEAQLDNTLEQSLRSRADDVRNLVEQGSSLERADRPRLELEEGFAQVLDRNGRVLDARRPLRQRPLLSARTTRGVGSGGILRDRASPFDRGENVRLLATTANRRGQRVVVVVGTALGDTEDALRNLSLLLAIGGPVALLLASLAGYGIASAALRPVEAMRRGAAAITEHDPGERLPLPPARDEIARLGATLNEMLARLEQALERERTFVADAGHELRTPLSILKAELELASREGRTHEELRVALASAAVETDRLARLAEDLLVIASVEKGGLPLRRTPVAPADVVRAVAARFEASAAGIDSRLKVGHADGRLIDADGPRLEQALGNLLENALRHGGATVELSTEMHDGVVEFHVRDGGPGLPPEFIGQAFERFARADAARARGGSGLGLSIVRVIARAHGGEAHVENAPEGGAHAWLEIPADRTVGPPTPARATGGRAAPRAGATRRSRP